MTLRKACAYARDRSIKSLDAVWFQLLGAGIGGALIYWSGIKVPATILDNPALSGVAAIVIGTIFGALAVFPLLMGRYVLSQLGIKLNLYLAIAALGAIICSVGLGAYILDMSRGQILWDWNFRWVNYSYHEDTDRIDFGRFEIVGQSRSDESILVSSAFVRSDIDPNDRIVMKAHVWTRVAGGGRQWSPTTTGVLPAQSRFLLYGKFDPDPDGYRDLTETEFRKRFGRFSFYFNSRLVKKFSANEVDRLIKKMFDDNRKTD